jgi:hypothetical protein
LPFWVWMSLVRMTKWLARARKMQPFLSQSFHVAVFTGSPGKYVDLKDSVAGFQVITCLCTSLFACTFDCLALSMRIFWEHHAENFRYSCPGQ